MPSLSPKSARLQASPIRKLAPHARAAEARGVKVHYLNIGQPDMPTPPQMIAELHGLPLNRLAYAPSEGLPEAREAWSAFYASWGIRFSPDEILELHPFLLYTKYARICPFSFTITHCSTESTNPDNQIHPRVPSHPVTLPYRQQYPCQSLSTGRRIETSGRHKRQS